MILQNHIVLVIARITKNLMDHNIDVFQLPQGSDVRQFPHANHTIKHSVLDPSMLVAINVFG